MSVRVSRFSYVEPLMMIEFGSVISILMNGLGFGGPVHITCGCSPKRRANIKLSQAGIGYFHDAGSSAASLPHCGPRRRSGVSAAKPRMYASFHSRIDGGDD